MQGYYNKVQFYKMYIKYKKVFARFVNCCVNRSAAQQKGFIMNRGISFSIIHVVFLSWL